MKRFVLVAPAALLVMLTVVPSVSAQGADAQAEWAQLKVDARTNHRLVLNVQRTVTRCGAPDENEVLALAETANDIANRAGGLAPRFGGRDHVTILNVGGAALDDFWWLMSFQSPAICYQPPA